MWFALFSERAVRAAKEFSDQPRKRLFRRSELIRCDKIVTQ
jgi:hypothetical protein